MRRLTVMNRDVELIHLDIDSDFSIRGTTSIPNSKDLLPVYLQNSRLNAGRKLVKDWIVFRSIPEYRPGFNRLLEKTGTKDIAELSLKSHSMNLSDQFWIRLEEYEEWNRLNFFNNSFSDNIGLILLKEEVALNSKLSTHSPSVATDGMVPKRWEILSGISKLLKGSAGFYTDAEVYREVFASLLASEVLPTKYVVQYTKEEFKDNIYSACKSFITDSTEYVSFNQIMNKYNKSNNASYYEYCKQFYKDEYFVLDWILLLDYIVMNEDRHYGNFGMIRSAITGEFLRPAPFFDTGSSMFYQSTIINKHRLSCKPFSNKFDDNIKRINMSEYKEGLYNLVATAEEHFETAFSESEEYSDEIRRTEMLEQVLSNIQTLLNKAR